MGPGGPESAIMRAMSYPLRHTAALLALAAMLLRAAIPAGWMPSAAGGGLLALCTADGLVQLLAVDAPDAAGSGGSHAPSADSSCPFGVTPSQSLPASAPQVVVAPVGGAAPDTALATTPVSPRLAEANPARAPPCPLIA